jgi:imidazolonepropionase-like amidohydrolase
VDKPEIVLLRNANVLDVVDGRILTDRSVLIRDGRIAEIGGPSAPTPATAHVIDLRGLTLMPGLCDAHVHLTAATPDFAALTRWSPTYVAARAGEILEGMLSRGFTTVRDAGGADFGLADAVEEGYLIGPRILFCGHALSQTGGHGDMRGRGEHSFEGCFCCAGLGAICDGVDEVRRACRHEIRKGATPTPRSMTSSTRAAGRSSLPIAAACTLSMAAISWAPCTSASSPSSPYAGRSRSRST